MNKQLDLRPEVAAFYFPQYHVDPQNEAWHGKGWDEWRLVRAATPRFPGHQQPKVPLWGYLDESKPETAQKQIDAAADHGIDAFIYDWYYYADGPFLERALEEGFLNAPNRNRLKFSLMWANHAWYNLFPVKRSNPDVLLRPGTVTKDTFERAGDYMIEKYFYRPNYWRVDGGLFLSFYELAGLVENLGGLEPARRVFEAFRDKVRRAGFGELHLNAVLWNIVNLPGAVILEHPEDMIKLLGFDSVTSYVWIHNVPLGDEQTVAYSLVAAKAAADWSQVRDRLTVPYFPNVSMGWDSSPRTTQTDGHTWGRYPNTPIVVDNTPAAFQAALEAAKDHLADGKTQPPIVTINNWNEWTEGSYLEPDSVNGLGYLQAVKTVFGVKEY